MKVKMLETVQGTEVSGTLRNGNAVTILEPGVIYEVSPTLGEWLVDNHKAKEITDSKKPVHYGAQDEPEFRHDDEKYKAMTAEPESEDEPKKAAGEVVAVDEPEEEPIMTTKGAPKRSKRTK